MAARVVLISVQSHDRERRPAHRHHDDREPAAWAKHREPRIEPEAKNLNLSLGRWIDRASANSGVRVAPGTGSSSRSS
jgi:hypothetical protein